MAAVIGRSADSLEARTRSYLSQSIDTYIHCSLQIEFNSIEFILRTDKQKLLLHFINITIDTMKINYSACIFLTKYYVRNTFNLLFQDKKRFLLIKSQEIGVKEEAQ